MPKSFRPLQPSGRDIFKTAHPTPWAMLLRLAAVTSLSVLLVFSSGWSLFNFNGNRTVRDHANYSESEDFDWASLTPSGNLNWAPCYERFFCSRFLVPLVHDQPSGRKAAIAVIKYPSRLNPGKEGRRASVLFNPGGPGSSGVRFLVGRAESFRTILGEEYDLIGFDPRGVGYSTPSLSTFRSAEEEAAFFSREMLTVNSSDHALGLLYERARLLGQLVKFRSGDITQYLTTSMVARDMLLLVNALGDEQIQYWGFSYGSVLGATFAAMFPDKVKRLIIDGVVDAENYYEGLWSHSLMDTDTSLRWLYRECVEAGPAVCPIYEQTASKIWDRVDKLLQNLKAQPVTFYNVSTSVYGEVDYSVAKYAIFSTLFKLHGAGRRLTFALADLEKGNAQTIYDLASKKIDLDAFSCDHPAESSAPFAHGSDINLAISCSDGRPVNYTMKQLQEFYEQMSLVSTFAEVMTRRIGCSGWMVEGKERFEGTFHVNTSFPILLIGNTADPVTPIENAHKMASRFNNSVVLTQDSPGHGSVSAVSWCTASAVRAYFREGILPKKGQICDVQSAIFSSIPKSWKDSEKLNDNIIQASENLMESYWLSDPLYRV